MVLAIKREERIVVANTIQLAGKLLDYWNDIQLQFNWINQQWNGISLRKKKILIPNLYYELMHEQSGKIKVINSLPNCYILHLQAQYPISITMESMEKFFAGVISSSVMVPERCSGAGFGHIYLQKFLGEDLRIPQSY